jgi:hypothetical protein
VPKAVGAQRERTGPAEYKSCRHVTAYGQWIGAYENPALVGHPHITVFDSLGLEDGRSGGGAGCAGDFVVRYSM